MHSDCIFRPVDTGVDVKNRFLKSLQQSQKNMSSLFSVQFTLLLVILLAPISIAAQDNVKILPMGNLNQPLQPNVKSNQAKNNLDNVKGIPVAVSFPKGDYQW